VSIYSGASGWADMMTAGLWMRFNKLVGWDTAIDPLSGAYKGGQAAGLVTWGVITVATLGAGAPAAGTATAYALSGLFLVNAVGSSINAGENIAQGRYGWAALDIAGAYFGVRGAFALQGASAARSAASATEARGAATGETAASEFGRISLPVIEQPVVGASRTPLNVIEQPIIGGSAGRLGFLSRLVCFAGDTPLITPHGAKAIEEFQLGDWIWSSPEDDTEAPPEPKQVEEVFKAIARLWNLRVGRQIIRTTELHPFYVRGKGWTEAHSLISGDHLRSHDGQWMVVQEVGDSGEDAPVYNLRVADYHTYFVGSEAWGFSVWAHNSCYADTFFKAFPELRGSVWVHHGVPQAVLKRYPGLFTEAEMHGLPNLRGIPNAINADLHLSKLNTAWARFYKKYPGAGRSDVEAFRGFLDRWFGNQFLPPVQP